jgi:methionyl-tRNA formyltransferase
MLKVAYFGSCSSHGLTLLPLLLSHSEVVAVVEDGDLDCGDDEADFSGPIGFLRRKLLRNSPYLFAQAKGIRAGFWNEARSEEIGKLLEETRPDLALVSSFPRMLPNHLLTIPRLGFVNIHCSALPAYRGPDPVSWMFLDGCEEGALTIHRTDEGEDTGDIFAQEPVPIPPGFGPSDYLTAAMQTCLRMLPDVLDGLEHGTLHGRRQSHLPCPQRARRLKSGEDPYRLSEWSLDQCARALQLLPSIRPRALATGPAARLDWRLSDVERGACPQTPGSLQHDASGWYLAHSEGRLRLIRERDWKARLKRGIIRLLLGK